MRLVYEELVAEIELLGSMLASANDKVRQARAEAERYRKALVQIANLPDVKCQEMIEPYSGCAVCIAGNALEPIAKEPGNG